MPSLILLFYCIPGDLLQHAAPRGHTVPPASAQGSALRAESSKFPRSPYATAHPRVIRINEEFYFWRL